MHYFLKLVTSNDNKLLFTKNNGNDNALLLFARSNVPNSVQNNPIYQ